MHKELDEHEVEVIPYKPHESAVAYRMHQIYFKIAAMELSYWLEMDWRFQQKMARSLS